LDDGIGPRKSGSLSPNPRPIDTLVQWRGQYPGRPIQWCLPEGRIEAVLEESTENRMRETPEMKRTGMWVVGALTLTLAVVSGVAGSAQDRYALKLPDGLPFSDFRGYGDWQLISSSKTDDRMKVILGNPTIIAAYKSGIPGNGKPFPEGSKIAKIQWKPKKSTEAPFVVDVPDTLADLFFMEKDSQKFPATGGWGYAQFDYDPAAAIFSADKAGTPSCGQSCHVAVKAKDYVFHPYQMR
jgi:Cytochrome P460